MFLSWILLGYFDVSAYIVLLIKCPNVNRTLCKPQKNQQKICIRFIRRSKSQSWKLCFAKGSQMYTRFFLKQYPPARLPDILFAWKRAGCNPASVFPSKLIVGLHQGEVCNLHKHRPRPVVHIGTCKTFAKVVESKREWAMHHRGLCQAIFAVMHN